MKKKTKIISFLLIVIVVLTIPVVGFLLFAYYPWEPETKGKIVETIKIIDLKKLPKGRFQKASIVTNNPGYKEKVIFEVPADKIAEFETGFRRCVQNATPIKGIITCLSDELRILTEKGKYSADIYYDDDGVLIQRSSLFHRGFSSRELRKVFYDTGLEYTSGGTREPRKKEVNESNYQEILRQAALKAAEYGKMVKEAKEGENTPNQPLQSHSE